MARIARDLRHVRDIGHPGCPGGHRLTTGPIWPENEAREQRKNERAIIPASDVKTSERATWPRRAQIGPSSGPGRAPVEAIAKDIFSIAKDAIQFLQDRKEKAENNYCVPESTAYIAYRKGRTNIKTQTQNLKTEISKGESEIEKADCPRCNLPLKWEEGWAYCEGCSGFFCTDAEAEKVRAHLAAKERKEYYKL